jgi:twitching motility protein PilT
MTTLFDRLLERVWDARGSDIHLGVGASPRLRVEGFLWPVSDEPDVRASDIEAIYDELLDDAHRMRMHEVGDVDVAVPWLDRARLRVSAYRRYGHPALAIRILPNGIPTLDEVGLPQIVRERTIEGLRGLVIFTGATGAGKSTTQASVVDAINASRPCHIMTIEDPIEFVHESHKAFVSQREVGTDTVSFAQALRSALREDPDVVLVGELRDTESMQIALTLAETGHLVLASLHTSDASQVFDRILDAMPDGAKNQTRAQLAASLTAVVAQRLVPKIDGGRVAAYEVLTATTAVRNTIREARFNQLPRLIAAGGDEGMNTLDKYLADLVVSKTVSVASALTHATDQDELSGDLERRAALGLYEPEIVA